jgi:hypothetical protein
MAQGVPEGTEPEIIFTWGTVGTIQERSDLDQLASGFEKIEVEDLLAGHHIKIGGRV